MMDPDKEAIAAFIHTSKVAMTLADPEQEDCPIISSNAAFQDLTGYSGAMIEGKNCRLLQGNRTDSIERRRLRDAVANRESSVSALLNFKMDGEPFNNLLMIEPLELGRGKVVLMGCQFGFDLSLELEAVNTQAKIRYLEVDRVWRATGASSVTPPANLQMRAEAAVMSVRNYTLKRRPSQPGP